MKLVVRLAAIVALCMAQIGLADAFSFHSPDGNFTVQFPEPPKLEKKTGNTQGGVAYELSLWSVDKGDSAYIVSMNVYAKPVQEEYDGPMNGVVGSCKGKLVDQQPFQLQEMTGREVFVECPGPLMFRERMLWVDSRLYQFLYVGPPGTENNAEVSAFLNSVHIGE
ncbi:MAG: hypothetical protein ACLPID_17960 [Beijerinckiaceae bacterium]